MCWPIACQRGDSTTTRKTWSSIHQCGLSDPLNGFKVEDVEYFKNDGQVSGGRRLEDFEDIDSMYSTYDNWHRRIIISRSASASIPTRMNDNCAEAPERGEEKGLDAVTDGQMFLSQNPSTSGGNVTVPFYKTILSNLSKKTYTVNNI